MRLAWRRFSFAFLATVTCVAVALFALVLLADPYDTGRFSIIRQRSPVQAAPFLATASRMRQPAFDAFILGNSHIQLIEPTRLSAATGLSFASVVLAGTAWREQLAVLDFVLQHRR